MEVRQDDVFNRCRIEPERLDRPRHRRRHRAPTFFRHRRVESRVDEERARRADDEPHEIGQRLQDVVRIPEQEVLA
jgi:hypothetical protein